MYILWKEGLGGDHWNIVYCRCNTLREKILSMGSNGFTASTSCAPHCPAYVYGLAGTVFAKTTAKVFAKVLAEVFAGTQKNGKFEKMRAIFALSEEYKFLRMKFSKN